MEIESPDDCYVLHITDQKIVKKGEVILKLYSHELAKAMSRVAAFSTSISISSRKFDDGRRDEIKAMLSECVRQLEQQLDCLKTIVAQHQAAVSIGLPRTIELNDAIFRVSSTTVMLEKQRLVLSQFDKETQDLRDNITNIKLHVDEELVRLRDLDAKMTIAAPFNADFVPNCIAGLFFKKGKVLGLLTPKE